MKATFAITESSSNPFFFPKPNIKRRIIMTAENYLLIIAAWLIAVGSIIIPRVIKKKPVSTNTSLGEISRGINSLRDAIYGAEGVGTAIIVTVIAALRK
jgi:hypothetical protein